MLQWFRKRAEAARRAQDIYGSVVTAARQRFFYEDMGVPDTPEGRFELLALHLFLVLESLKGHPRADDRVLQRTIEAFVTDMDDSMREMGVGDLTVPKKVRRAAGAFYERAADYRQALAKPENADLEASFRRHIFVGDAAHESAAPALARYVRRAAATLSRTPIEEQITGRAFLKISGKDEVAVS
jgi:cytochrome b pre-mRNA-processing protein 3